MLKTEVQNCGKCYVVKLEVKIPHPLDARQHARFDYQKAFAGLTVRGIPLSHKTSKQTGQAKIGDVPWLEQAPEGWIKVGRNVRTIFTTNPKPNFCFVGTISSVWEGPEIALDPKDKVENWTTGGSFNTYDEKSEVLLGLDKAALTWLADNPGKAQFSWFNAGAHLKMVPLAELTPDEWALFKRYIPTERQTAPLNKTVRLEAGPGLPVRSKTIAEAEAAYGIHVLELNSFWQDHLLVSSLEVRDLALFEPHFPLLVPFAGRNMRFGATTYSQMQLPIEQSKAILDALPNGSVLLSDRKDRLFFERGSVVFDRLPAPIRVESTQGGAQIFCTAEHIHKGLVVSARDAKLKRQIPDTLPSAEALTGRHEQCDGNWFLLDEIMQFPERSLKTERVLREERKKRLLAELGKLPEDWNRFTDEELKAHFSILGRQAAGELHLSENHPVCQALDWHGRQNILEWLKKSTDYVVSDPIGQRNYIRHFDGLEEFADHDQFKDLLNAVFGNTCLLQQLILSPRVQAAVGASRI